MKKLILIMAATGLVLSSCNPGTEKSTGAQKKQTVVEQNKTTTQNTMEKQFTYKDGDVQEVITVQFTSDGKEVVSATHSTEGGDTHPISFMDLEYAEDIDLFMGAATCPAWDGEAMIDRKSVV